jgi:hypothetical protein
MAFAVDLDHDPYERVDNGLAYAVMQYREYLADYDPTGLEQALWDGDLRWDISIHRCSDRADELIWIDLGHSSGAVPAVGHGDNVSFHAVLGEAEFPVTLLFEWRYQRSEPGWIRARSVQFDLERVGQFELTGRIALALDSALTAAMLLPVAVRRFNEVREREGCGPAWECPLGSFAREMMLDYDRDDGVLDPYEVMMMPGMWLVDWADIDLVEGGSQEIWPRQDGVKESGSLAFGITARLGSD